MNFYTFLLRLLTNLAHVLNADPRFLASLVESLYLEQNIKTQTNKTYQKLYVNKYFKIKEAWFCDISNLNFCFNLNIQLKFI